MSIIRRSDEARMVAIIAALWLIFSVGVSNFATAQTFTNILDRGAIDGVLAVGLSLCLLGGEIDLSIGANLALSSVIFATLAPKAGAVVAVVTSLAAGALIGIVNSLLVNYIGVISFVASLGTMLLAQGLALLISHGTPVSSFDFGLALNMVHGMVGPVAPPALVLFAVALIAQLFIVATRPGRELVAIGSDSHAARSAGVSDRARRSMAFILCGTCASTAGVVSAMTLASGSPTQGSQDLLNAVAAAFVSGVALSGGRGSALAAALAAEAIASLAVGLDLASVPSAYVQTITGALIVLVGLPLSIRRSRDWFKLRPWPNPGKRIRSV